MPSTKGGAWLLEPVAAEGIFTPERLSEEHRLMAQTTEAFVNAEVLPELDRLESKDWTLARSVLRRCGELGLLGISAPEEFGGLDLDKASALVVVERIARSASFATIFGGQANLTILPLVLFGTQAQKEQYLPRLIGGEIIGA
jgi:alkylation response protein AidB-like acyl-CoA dehydrogenase